MIRRDVMTNLLLLAILLVSAPVYAMGVMSAPGASSFSDLSGTLTDAQVPNTITVDRATVATTADALTSNPADCGAGELATGIGASGALSCTASPTVTTLNATTVNIGGTAVSPSLTGTTPGIGGGALLAGGCTSGTVAVTGSTTAMAVAVTPNTYPGDGTLYYGYVSTNGTVTVKVCAIVALTPVSSSYNVKVVQ